jgi:hypothetical protein
MYKVVEAITEKSTWEKQNSNNKVFRW